MPGPPNKFKQANYMFDTIKDLNKNYSVQPILQSNYQYLISFKMTYDALGRLNTKILPLSPLDSLKSSSK